MSEPGEMIDRVAKAIWTGDWDDMHDEVRATVRHLARAAITAMREPTKAMREAGYASPLVNLENLGDWKQEQVTVDWRAMIDAALEQ